MYISKFDSDRIKINPRYVVFIDKKTHDHIYKIIFVMQKPFIDVEWHYQNREDCNEEFQELGKNKQEQFLEKFEPIIKDLVKVSETYLNDLKEEQKRYKEDQDRFRANPSPEA